MTPYLPTRITPLWFELRRPISETKPLVVGADEYLVTQTDFDLSRASDIEGIRAAQIQDHFFPRSKSYDDSGKWPFFGPLTSSRICNKLINR